MVVLAKLLASEQDIQGYITYVFECLREDVTEENKYIMCTRFPNWESRTLEIGEVGFLNFVEIRAGVDKWYDGNKFIPYRYNNVQFIKFVEKKEKQEHKFIM